MSASPLPDWCFEEDEVVSEGEEVGERKRKSEDDGSQRPKKKRQERDNEVSMATYIIKNKL